MFKGGSLLNHCSKWLTIIHVIMNIQATGAWEDWERWQHCSSSVTYGLRKRIRKCGSLLDSESCSGTGEEFQRCGSPAVQVNEETVPNVKVKLKRPLEVVLQIGHYPRVNGKLPSLYRIDMKSHLEPTWSFFTKMAYTPSKEHIVTIPVARNLTYSGQVHVLFDTEFTRVRTVQATALLTFTADSPCPRGMFGPRCDHHCHCSPGGDCDDWLGRCSSGCLAYYTGDNCQQVKGCPSGAWGTNCDKPCACPFKRDCGDLTGQCPKGCIRGRWGKTCDKTCDCKYSLDCHDETSLCLRESPCLHNTFGDDCQYKCSCKDANEKCDEHTGNCSDGCTLQSEGLCFGDCVPQRWGPQCKNRCHCQPWEVCRRSIGCISRCKEGFWGRNCEKPCRCRHALRCGENGHCFRSENCRAKNVFGDDCQYACACNNPAEQCHDSTGFCSSGCQLNVDGTCITRCIDGLWGDNCKNTCHCKPWEICTRLKGCVPQCPDGFWGDSCSTSCQCKFSNRCHHQTGQCMREKGCVGRVFGDDCQYKCNCADLTETCDDRTGNCTSGCASGDVKELCHANCVDGQWGKNCKNVCNCSANQLCKRSSGCFIPHSCNGLTFGDNCQYKCNCNDPTEKCDDTTGNCTTGCVQRSRGLCHGDCVDGMWGNDCKKKCRCEKSETCHRNLGCLRQPCKGLTFGDICQYKCNCRDPTQKCNDRTGNCTTGCVQRSLDLCHGDCVDGMWGSDCKQKCECEWWEACDRKLGCVYGESCPNPNSYGPQCDQQCHCATRDGCYRDSGNCRGACPVGWSGSDCKTQSPCPLDRTYGKYCELICHCISRSCHRDNGSCVDSGGCQQGWMGDLCNKVKRPHKLKATRSGTATTQLKGDAAISTIILSMMLIAFSVGFLLFLRRVEKKRKEQVNQIKLSAGSLFNLSSLAARQSQPCHSNDNGETLVNTQADGMSVTANGGSIRTKTMRCKVEKMKTKRVMRVKSELQRLRKQFLYGNGGASHLQNAPEEGNLKIEKTTFSLRRNAFWRAFFAGKPLCKDHVDETVNPRISEIGQEMSTDEQHVEMQNKGERLHIEPIVHNQEVDGVFVEGKIEKLNAGAIAFRRIKTALWSKSLLRNTCNKDELAVPANISENGKNSSTPRSPIQINIHDVHGGGPSTAQTENSDRQPSETKNDISKPEATVCQVANTLFAGETHHTDVSEKTSFSEQFEYSGIQAPVTETGRQSATLPVESAAQGHHEGTGI